MGQYSEEGGVVGWLSLWQSAGVKGGGGRGVGLLGILSNAPELFSTAKNTTKNLSSRNSVKSDSVKSDSVNSDSVKYAFCQIWFCQVRILSNLILSTTHSVKSDSVNYAFCQIWFCQVWFCQVRILSTLILSTTHSVKYASVNSVLSSRILSNPEERATVALLQDAKLATRCTIFWERHPATKAKARRMIGRG